MACLTCTALGCSSPPATARDAQPPEDAALSSVDVTAVRWEAADRLFEDDGRWLGGDAAYSVPLGGDRVLWLFGDSFIATSASRIRSESVMVRNAVGLQQGLDPTTATMAFHWSEPEGPGRPEAFFTEPLSPETWLWPLHGVRLGSRLLLFFSREAPASGGLGFEPVDWQARRVENPDDDPALWQVVPVYAPPNPWRIFLGTAVLREGAFLYVYGLQEPSHDVFLQRFTLADAGQGRLEAGEWYCGDGRFSLGCEPAPVVREGAPEFSVHRDAGSGLLILVETTGFGAAELAVRTAPRPEGPFGPPERVLRPPESDWPEVLVYAGKAHPGLEVALEPPGTPGGRWLAATYVANSLDFGTLVSDPRYYFPRFVALRLAP